MVGRMSEVVDVAEATVVVDLILHKRISQELKTTVSNRPLQPQPQMLQQSTAPPKANVPEDGKKRHA